MPSICEWCEISVYILCMWKCIVWCVHCSMWSPCNETQVWSKWTMTRWRPETSVNAKSTVITWLDSTPFLVTLHALCWHIQYRPWQCEKLKLSQPVVLRKTKLSCCWEHKKWTLIVRREEQCPFFIFSDARMSTLLNAKLLYLFSNWLALPYNCGYICPRSLLFITHLNEKK